MYLCLYQLNIVSNHTDASVHRDVGIAIFADVSAPLPQIPDTNGSITLGQQASTRFRSLAKKYGSTYCFPMLIALIPHISHFSVSHESDSSDNEQLLAFTLKKLKLFPFGGSDI